MQLIDREEYELKRLEQHYHEPQQNANPLFHSLSSLKKIGCRN